MNNKPKIELLVSKIRNSFMMALFQNYFWRIISPLLFALGVLFVALRLLYPNLYVAYAITSGVVSFVVLIATCLILVFKNMPDKKTLLVVLDNRLQCGGLLSANCDNLDCDDWLQEYWEKKQDLASLVLPKVKINTRKYLNTFLLSLVFIIVCVLIPVRFNYKDLVDDPSVNKRELLNKELQVMQESGLVKENEIEILQDELKKLEELGINSDPLNTLALLENIEQQIQSLKQESLDEIEQEFNELNDSESLLKAMMEMTKQQRMTTEDYKEGIAALKEMFEKMKARDLLVQSSEYQKSMEKLAAAMEALEKAQQAAGNANSENNNQENTACENMQIPPELMMNMANALAQSKELLEQLMQQSQKQAQQNQSQGQPTPVDPQQMKEMLEKMAQMSSDELKEMLKKMLEQQQQCEQGGQGGQGNGQGMPIPIPSLCNAMGGTSAERQQAMQNLQNFLAGNPGQSGQRGQGGQSCDGEGQGGQPGGGDGSNPNGVTSTRERESGSGNTQFGDEKRIDLTGEKVKIDGSGINDNTNSTHVKTDFVTPEEKVINPNEIVSGSLKNLERGNTTAKERTLLPRQEQAVKKYFENNRK